MNLKLILWLLSWERFSVSIPNRDFMNLKRKDIIAYSSVFEFQSLIGIL